MSKPMKIMLALTGLLFGGIFAYKMFQAYMSKQYMSGNNRPPVTIAALPVKSESWQPTLIATASVRAIKGVDITTEIAGLVKHIKFTPGQEVQEGSVILELNADAEKAELKSLEAQAELAKINYNRSKEQFAIQAVSQASLDAHEADLKSKKAQVLQQEAIVDKKTIEAPFSGRLGISLVNPGQYLNPGDKIATLQSLHPIYLDFNLPQQAIPQISKGQTVKFMTDTYPGEVFVGKITTVNPKVDLATRNFQVEATLPNTKTLLFPGMFGQVQIDAGAPENILTLPQTAISYNSYGDLVFILKKQEKDFEGKPIYQASEKFVALGKTKGDKVQILKGVSENDLIVVEGQAKLKNGSFVVINNESLSPPSKAPPK